MGEDKSPYSSSRDAQKTIGADALVDARQSRAINAGDDFTFDYNSAYGRYFRIQKVLVGVSGAKELEEIGDSLEHSAHPNYLNVAGWAYLEAAISGYDRESLTRLELVDKAELAWQNCLETLEVQPRFHPENGLNDFSDSYRIALNIAYTPLVKSIISGDVTEAVREKVFADTLAIAEMCIAQQQLSSHLPDQTMQQDVRGDFAGLLHECNCLLALLYRNDPQRVPMPSSARAGSGLEYVSETHDIVVIHQKWGNIHRTTPIEVKAHCGNREYDRYSALIVRGKAHLLPQNLGHHKPTALVESFSEVYNSDNPSRRALDSCRSAALVVEKLLVDYQKNQRIDHQKCRNTTTHFHDSPNLGRYASRAALTGVG